MHPIALLILCQLQFTKSGEHDLDGDGKKESIALTGEASFKLQVGSASFAKKMNEPAAGFAVIDFDSSDRSKELLIDGASDAGDYHEYSLVKYEKGKLSELGTFSGVLPSDPTFPGNKSVRIQPWFGFFQATEKLELVGGKLERVKQAFYYVGVSGKPKGSPKMYRAPDKKAVVGVLTPGQPIDIIGYQPSDACKPKESAPFKPCDAFVVKSSAGLVGWIFFEDIEEQSLPWAG